MTETGSGKNSAQSISNSQQNISYESAMSQSVAGLFQDPLSELTRKRQNYLLLSSIIAILLAQGIVIFTEITAEGTKGDIPNPSTLIPVAGLLVIYFAVVYVVGAWQDYIRHRYERMERYAVLFELSDRSTRELIETARESLEPKEVLEIRDKYNEPIKRLQESLINAKEDRSQRIAQDIERLMREKINAEKRVRELLLKRATGLADRIKFVKKTFDTYNWLSNIRFAVEVLFPLILAGIAIYQTGPLSETLKTLWKSVVR